MFFRVETKLEYKQTTKTKDEDNLLFESPTIPLQSKQIKSVISESINESETDDEQGFEMKQLTHDGGRKTIVQYGVNHTEDDINDSLPDSDDES